MYSLNIVMGRPRLVASIRLKLGRYEYDRDLVLLISEIDFIGISAVAPTHPAAQVTNSPYQDHFAQLPYPPQSV